MNRTASCFVPTLLLLAACHRSPPDTSPKKSWFVCQVPPGRPAESFSSAMQVAMARMDQGMNVTPSGDPDRDFAAMMIPHHQGAVDMALAELRFGRDEQLRRLAAGIIVEQRSEIALMQQIVGQMRPPSIAPAPIAPENELASQLGASR